MSKEDREDQFRQCGVRDTQLGVASRGLGKRGAPLGPLSLETSDALDDDIAAYYYDSTEGGEEDDTVARHGRAQRAKLLGKSQTPVAQRM